MALMASVLLISCGRNDWKKTDTVTVLSESRSQDGKHIATVFSCSGGGAAGYAYTNVNLRKASETLNQRDVLLGERLWNSYEDISVSWKDATTLEVSYSWTRDDPDFKKQNGENVPEKYGVRVTYNSPAE